MDSLYDMLMNPNKTSKLGLKGQNGPEFENEGQKTTSDIQALANGGALIDSQDMLKGRIYAVGYKPAFAPPSQLDLNGQTPDNPSSQVPYLKYGPKF